MLFLTYLHFLCKWKSLPCWQNNYVPFQSNPIQSTVTFLSSKQAPDKAVLRPGWREAAVPGCAIPSPQVLQIRCRAACCREAREMISSLLIYWTLPKWKQPQQAKHLRPPCKPLFFQVFFFTCPQAILDKPGPQTTLSDGAINYLFMNSLAHPHP